MSERERQKNVRRQHILDNAERLIRETGGTDFSTRVLAADADVAFATPFNLFGSKEGLLYSLLERSLDQITDVGLTFSSRQRGNRVVEATRKAVAAFFFDPELLRPLYLVLLSVSHPEHRPRFMERTLAFWTTAAVAAADPNLDDPKAIESVARSLMAHFIGVLEMWVHRDISDDQFERQAVTGAVLLTRGICRPSDRARLDKYLDFAV